MKQPLTQIVTTTADISSMPDLVAHGVHPNWGPPVFLVVSQAHLCSSGCEEASPYLFLPHLESSVLEEGLIHALDHLPKSPS